MALESAGKMALIGKSCLGGNLGDGQLRMLQLSTGGLDSQLSDLLAHAAAKALAEGAG